MGVGDWPLGQSIPFSSHCYHPPAPPKRVSFKEIADERPNIKKLWDLQADLRDEYTKDALADILVYVALLEKSLSLDLWAD